MKMHSLSDAPTKANRDNANSQQAMQMHLNLNTAPSSQRADVLTRQAIQKVADDSPRTSKLQRCARLPESSASTTTLQLAEQMANHSPQALRSADQADVISAGRAKPPLLKAAPDASAALVQRETIPNHTGLPDQLKSGIESLSGISLDQVKVHYNSHKPAQLQAHAYAQGSEIHIGPGQEKHLPHEAWHIVQQAQGRVRPTMQMKGAVSINDDSSLEAEADMMGAMALNSQIDAGELTQPLQQGQQAVQRIVARNGKIWSSYLPSVFINEKQAVITAGSADSLTGGHSFVILEYLASDNLVHALRIDLFVGPDGKMPIVIKNRQVEVKPWEGISGGLLSMVGQNDLSVQGDLEVPGKSSSHIIKNSSAAAVIAMAESYKDRINEEHYYSQTGYGLSFSLFSGKTPINCTWFAAMLLEKAGVSKASVIPSVLADQKSTPEEDNARFKV